MLRLQNNNEGITFTVINKGNKMPFDEWSLTDDVIYYMPLSVLVDNGCAEVIDGDCFVPFESLYFIEEDDRYLLGIPRNYNRAMRLRSEGMLNTSTFKYVLEFLSHVPDGELLKCNVIGNIITIDNEKFLLNEEQYHLINRVQQYNSEDEDVKETEYNLRVFSEIKELANKANCKLDSYLASENVFVPEKIKIEVGYDEQGYTIEPALEIEENPAFQRYFEKGRRVLGQYPLQKENGERVRVVLNQSQKEGLEQLKITGGKHKTREQIKEFIETPTEFFDPDQFDLSEFYSDRVLEIGVYKPKFYPFVSPYRSTWIVGAEIESPENGTSKVEIKSEEELEELENLISEAEKEGKEVLSYDNTLIGIEDAKFLASTAREQFSSPSEPVGNSGGRDVLIIEENAEVLGFEEERPELKNDGRYTLYKNNYLKENYQLKTHQKEGVAWLQHLYQCHAGGCLLADDMGLGKTLQILYFIDWHARNDPNHNPYLIIAPVSLMENWENEYARFFMEPRLKVQRIVSSSIPRQFNQKVIDAIKKEDIILTSYETLRNGQLNFCAVDYDVVVMDEAQKIKTPGTMVTNAAKALKSKFKIAMTGTPVENTLMDLWCIMDFCVPGLLGNAKSFAAKYQTPLRNPDTDLEGIGNEIHNNLGLHFMRRVKSEVAKDLPNKYEIKESRDMPKVQEDTYQKVVNEYLSGIQDNMLVTINHIRSVSEHPYLYDLTIQEKDLPELIETSARLQLTVKFLDGIKSKDEKVIIFSERKEIQRLLQRMVWDRYGIVAKVVNGDTPSSQISNRQSRQACVDDFQKRKGFNVIIMSPVAAGMGLNVTAANHVIHYSRHWNPAKEGQATDRAYRIGQTKDVYVYYPMAVSPKFPAFDVTLDELLSRKSHLATSTIYPTEKTEVRVDELGGRLFNQK